MSRFLWALTSVGLVTLIAIIAENSRIDASGASRAAGGVMVVMPPPPSTRAAADNGAPDVQDADYPGTIVPVGPASVAPGLSRIVLNIRLPQGYAFNDSAPFAMHVNRSGGVVTVVPADNDLSIVLPTMPVAMPATFHTGQTTLKVDANVFYCEAVNESRCYPVQLRFEVPLTVRAGNQADLVIDYLITLPSGFGN